MTLEGPEPVSPTDAVAQVFRLERGRVLAALRRATSTLEEAEDLLASAFEKALVRWTEDGVPERPGAWLLTVARNDALGAHRHRKMAAEKHEDLAFPGRELSVQSEPASREYPDERLPLLFTCCHPSLEQASQVALTLSVLSGLSTGEIARAFVVPQTTMAQRIVRAKRKIRAAGVPYQVPEQDQLPERLAGVLQVVYLIFTEGYRASQGERRIRADLCEDALLLAHALAQLLPEEPEALGLEALLWFHHARRDARQDTEGGVVFLEDQDRTRFHPGEIAHAEGLLLEALRHKQLGPYQLQAAIAAQHCLAPSFQMTPWQVIVGLYDKLYEISPSPVVALNRAAAIGLGSSADAGLLEMERLGLARSLNDYAPYHAARGELSRRKGDLAGARASFARARLMVESGPEIAHLERRLAEISEN